MSWDFFRIWGTVFNCGEFPTIALIAQQYESPSIELLSVSISTITLAPAFANDVFMNLVDRQSKFCSKLISFFRANFFRAILDLDLDLEAILRKAKSYWKYRLICNIRRFWFFCCHLVIFPWLAIQILWITLCLFPVKISKICWRCYQEETNP